MRRILAILVVVLALLAFDRAQVMSVYEPLPAAERAGVMAAARGALKGDGAAKGDGALPAYPVRGVGLTMWLPQGESVRGGWAGDEASIPEAISRAAADLRPRLSEPQLQGGRLQVDLIREVQPLHVTRGPVAQWFINPGLDGLLVVGEGASRLIPPEDLLHSGADVDSWLQRAQAGVADRSPQVFRTRGVSQIEAQPRGDDILPWVRGAPPLGEDAHAALEAASRAAGDYLARSVNDKGRFCYVYDAHRDRCGGGYNMLRHGGTAFALAQAYGRFGDDAWLPPLRRSLDTLLEASQVDETAGQTPRRYILDGKQAKLGGAGLGLLALVEYTRVTGDERYNEAMTELAAFILSMQRPSGFMESWYQWDPALKIPTSRSIYYPGEALLALIRLYQLRGGGPELMAGIRLAADFLVNDRWSAMGTEVQVPPDAWLTQALVSIMEEAPEAYYRDYVYRITDVISQFQLRVAEAPPPHDLGGGTIVGLGLPSVAVTGGRLEAVAAGARMAQALGEGQSAERLGALAVEMSLFAARFQVSELSAVAFKAPRRAAGGLPEKPGGSKLRNDYTQHVLSGWLGTLAYLDTAGRAP